MPSGKFLLPDKIDYPAVLLSDGVGLTRMVSMLEAFAHQHAGHPSFYIRRTASRDTHIPWDRQFERMIYDT